MTEYRQIYVYRDTTITPREGVKPEVETTLTIDNTNICDDYKSGFKLGLDIGEHIDDVIFSPNPRFPNKETNIETSEEKGMCYICFTTPTTIDKLVIRAGAKTGQLLGFKPKW